jgi:hypothetical protein
MYNQKSSQEIKRIFFEEKRLSIVEYRGGKNSMGIEMGLS